VAEQEGDFEEVLRFFEALDRGSSQQGGATGAAQAGLGGGSSGAGSGQQQDGVDWKALERVFLGKDWERRELADLHDGMAKVGRAAVRQRQPACSCMPMLAEGGQGVSLLRGGPCARLSLRLTNLQSRLPCKRGHGCCTGRLGTLTAE